MNEQIGHRATFKIPALIKRNTALVALSQSFTGAGMQMAYGVGPLMVVALSGSSGLAGLSVGVFALSRFLVAYPVGRITDVYGRKPGIMLGLTLALLGTLAVALAMNTGSLAALVVGMLIFGMGMNAAQQLRVAAADMFPPRMRAQALGYVATGSLVGLVISPILIAGGDRYAAQFGLEPLSAPWLFLPVLILGGMGMVTLIRPDPKVIGLKLEAYYPGYAPPPEAGKSAGSTHFSARELLRNPAARLAIACNAAAQANMSIVMVLTSLMLSHHGHSLSEIGLSHMFHSAGMFAFTIPLGWLADRLGRGRIMYPGVIASLIGACLVTFGETYGLITLGAFLVGLGWSGANVAATALIADASGAAQRGRAIGVNDSFAGAAAVATAVVTGPLIQWMGLGAAGVAAVLFALPPLLMRLAQGTRGSAVK
ncbi:MAG: major facilitator superfamily protein [Hyphomicrobiales bacterium]|nr:major facilitator superfamily protein [Hyphomicrobiales bacterium]